MGSLQAPLSRVCCLCALWPVLFSHDVSSAEVDWFVLLTEDEEAAAHFYANLFGWEFERGPGDGLIAVHRGTPIGGISQVADTLPGVSEAIWLAAISVPDVEASSAVAAEQGGTMLSEVTRVEGLLTYALIEDPQGAPLVLSSEQTLIGGTQGGGAWLWAELWTNDPDGAMQFYADVAGFSQGTVERQGGTYNVLSSDGVQRAGVARLSEDSEVSPRWAPYLGVQDLRATLVRVWSLDGQVILEPAEIDDEQRTALILDSTGGALFLYQLDEEQIAAGQAPVQSLNADGTPASDVVFLPMPEERKKQSNVHLSISVGAYAGYGPGWGPSFRPGYPYGPYPYY